MTTASDKSTLSAYDRRKIVEFLNAEDLDAVDPDGRKTFRGDSIERWVLTIRRRSGCKPTATNDEVLDVWRDHYAATRPVVEALETTPPPTREEIWQDAAQAAPDDTEDDAAGNRPKFRLEPWDAAPLTNPREIVSGILEEGITGGIVGRSGRGKSFVVYDMACCIATGTDWHGRRTKQKRVALIVGEGRSGALRRLHGWSRYHGIEIPSDHLLVSSMGGRFADPAFMEGIHNLLDETPVDVLIVDTLNRNAGTGFNENDTEAMTEFVSNLDALREAHGLTVLVVHHTGWGPQDRARGSSVFTASLDAEFIVAREDDDGPIILSNSKMKDSEPPPPMAFELRQVVLEELRREDGSQVTTAVIVEVDPPKKSTTAGTGKNQTLALDHLRTLWTEARANVAKSGRDRREAAVTFDTWEQRAKGKSRKADGEHIPYPRWKEVWTSLVDAGRVRFDGPIVHIVEDSPESPSEMPGPSESGPGVLHTPPDRSDTGTGTAKTETVPNRTGSDSSDTMPPEQKKWWDDHREDVY
jgi:hypothetical protein